MFYTVLLTPSERELLTGLVGQQLDLIRADGWSALLQAGDITLHVQPEEVATPDPDHPYGDVQRPLVRTPEGRDAPFEGRIVAASLGSVRAVNIITTFVSFSPVVVCPPEEIVPGVVIPESQGYDWVYRSAARSRQGEGDVGHDAAEVELDIAIEIITESNPSMVFYTSGYFIRVSADGLPHDEEWVELEALVRHSL